MLLSISKLSIKSSFVSKNKRSQYFIFFLDFFIKLYSLTNKPFNFSCSFLNNLLSKKSSSILYFNALIYYIFKNSFKILFVNNIKYDIVFIYDGLNFNVFILNKFIKLWFI